MSEGLHNKVLVTRPLPEGADYALELEERGYETVIAPMLEVSGLDFEPPNLEIYQGLVFTSATAVRFYCEQIGERDLPVFCVGDYTATTALEAGFTQVHSAAGSSQDLAAFVVDYKDGQRPFLHVRAKTVAREMAGDFQALDMVLASLVVYESIYVERLPEAALESFRRGRIGAVVFFSKRTVKNFLVMVEKYDLIDSLKSTKALCISQGVVECVRVELWAQVLVASCPDRRGIEALLEECMHIQDQNGQDQNGQTENIQGLEKDDSDMGTQNSEASIENAGEVIERFGGIRPMAKKMDVAVTTVQGWKKRDSIPATRRDDVITAAAAHNVDLSGLVEGAPPANENEKSTQGLTFSSIVDMPEAVKPQHVKPDPYAQKIKEAEQKAVAKSVWIALVLILLAVAAVVMLLWPQKQDSTRLSMLESDVQTIQNDVDAVKDRQSFFGTMIPEDLGAQLSNLKEQAGVAREQLGKAMVKAQEVSHDVLAEDAGTMDQRMAKLGEHAQDIMQDPTLAGFMDKINGMRSAENGEFKLDMVMSQLSAMMNGAHEIADNTDSSEGTVDSSMSALEQPSGHAQIFENLLVASREVNPVIGETFAGVPTSDLKAAVMLLGMTQFRSSLNRDNQAFDDDLNVLMGLVGEEDVELKAALQRLAPHAKEGVLTPSGLTNEFKSMAGDAVVASLSGEDVSLGEKASARVNDIFQVEKDGALITGTETQGQLSKAQNMLNEGDIEGAIAAAQGLDGEAAAVMAPWIKKAQVSVLVKQVQQLLTQNMNAGTFGSMSKKAVGGITASGQGSGGRLVRDEASGINILVPPSSGANGIKGAAQAVQDANPNN